MPKEAVSPRALEALKAPPLVEVICTIHHAPLPQLDPILIGAFWNTIRDAYPHHTLRPAIVEASLTGSEGAPPMRSWLISEGSERLLQFQRDRFIFNWRAIDTRYPRFSSPDGVLELTTRMFGEYRAFLKREFAVVLAPSSVEVIKVDLLRQGLHWSSLSDAATMLPSLETLLRSEDETRWALSLSNAWRQRDCDLRLHLTAIATPGGTALQMESSASTEASENTLETSLRQANLAVNEVFSSLIPEPQRKMRFHGVQP
ncbi:MAG: TIGR04255 family protein [Deltaproteobacteria bacterium]|nr:TIGR04255 family protein [Deltaproteobacteria bacterium]